MVLPVVYRQAARREILSAARIYEEQRRELGSLFLDEIARIETHISLSMLQAARSTPRTSSL
jgi:hypothetical protein